MKQIARSLLLFGSLALYSLIDNQPAEAQIAPDGTLSTTVTTPDGSNFTIEDGNRAGGNLFHSFSEFSVPNGGSAFFNNAADVQNIRNRVTGGSVSNIDGLIGANCCANLFLLNPAGIIFGPNASLNIGGSFYGSTADSLVFPEGEFSATDTQAPPLLTINAPIGLNFRDNPQPITNRSTVNDVGLEVNTGENITLVGGNINFEYNVPQKLDGRLR
jgi:filamentous hemagglutinin family protein